VYAFSFKIKKVYAFPGRACAYIKIKNKGKSKKWKIEK
jgi:hypothetical protein